VENDTDLRVGDKIIPVSVRRSKLAKRISIRIPPAKNKVVVTLPGRASLNAGIKFLNSKVSWVLANVDLDSSVALSEGVTIPVLGKHYTITRMNGRGTSRLDMENGQLVVYCMPEFTARRVRDFLKTLLREECEQRAHALAVQLDKTVLRVSVTRANSRWGSCTASGALTFNWLLVFAPVEILQYIIAHEIAHLREMNHSNRFWRLVEKIYPGMDAARKWLKKEGHKLHRYE